MQILAKLSIALISLVFSSLAYAQAPVFEIPFGDDVLWINGGWVRSIEHQGTPAEQWYVEVTGISVRSAKNPEFALLMSEPGLGVRALDPICAAIGRILDVNTPYANAYGFLEETPSSIFKTHYLIIGESGIRAASERFMNGTHYTGFRCTERKLED